MKRRDMLKALGLASSHALFPSVLSGFISGCSSSAESLLFFTEQEFGIVTEIIDIILPETKSAAASATGTQFFLDEVFAKCLPEEQQSAIKTGLQNFKIPLESSPNKLELLAELDQRAFRYEPDALWFMAIKQYAMVGFFTSKEGETVASNYQPVPGEYQGDIPADSNTLNYGETGLRFYL